MCIAGSVRKTFCTTLDMNDLLLLFFRTDTCSLTLAVSRGNVTISAQQAASPALAIFTPSGGGTSEGLSPTMFPNAAVKGLHKHTI